MIPVKIINKKSGKALDLDAGRSDNGTKIQQWGFAGNNNQLWNLKDQGNNRISIHSKATDKVLDVDWSGRTQNGTKVQQWSFGGGDNQLWIMQDRGGGYVTFTSRISNKVLTVSGDANKDGSQIVQQDYDAQNPDKQLWKVTKVPMPEMQVLKSVAFKDDVRRISFEKNGYPLDYHYITAPASSFPFLPTKHRWQHLQDMLRLPDSNGKQYYMGTYSQNVSDTEGGMVFVGEVFPNSNSGKVIWMDTLTNKHPAGGYNHPCELRRIGDVVVICGQNWDGTTLAGIGVALGADAMNEGTGSPQNVLFYDVTNPASPTYIGKMNSCWQGNQEIKYDGQIDALTASKSGDYYYLSFGRGQNGKDNIKGMMCRSKWFSPHEKWELIFQKLDYPGSIPVKYELNNQSYIGGVRVEGDTKVIYDKIVFSPGGDKLTPQTSQVSRQDVTTQHIPEHPFGDGATFNPSILEDGRGYMVIANVESNEKIEIAEIETYSSDVANTKLRLYIGNATLKCTAMPGGEDGELEVYYFSLRSARVVPDGTTQKNVWYTNSSRWDIALNASKTISVNTHMDVPFSERSEIYFYGHIEEKDPWDDPDDTMRGESIRVRLTDLYEDALRGNTNQSYLINVKDSDQTIQVSFTLNLGILH